MIFANVISNSFQRQRAMEAIQSAPEGAIVSIEEPKRTLPQNVAIHGCVRQFAQANNWMFRCQPHDLRDFKRICVSGYYRATGHQARFTFGIEDELVPLDLSTRSLTKKQGSEFIDYVSSITAQLIRE